ncbi:MAG TPA: tetratricopeptide repeat protein [Pyrinomonadaceae bacterium]|nr:tetratricopeptide repeat protein [Pyrinomonadaceae bacterium]
MTKTCPSCDILAPPDARYCRHCGTPLKRIGETSADDNISPIAATVPLSTQNTTDEIIAPAQQQQQQQSAATTHTSEVSHDEMNALLRSGNGAPPHGYAPDDFDPEQTQITINVRPLTSHLPADAAATASSSVATRANNKPQFNSTPQQVTLSPSGALQPVPAPTTDAQATDAPHSSPSTPAAARSTESRALRVWLGTGLAIVSIVAIICVAVALWLGSRAWRNSEPPPPAIASEAPTPVVNDPKQLALAKLLEADALIASGNSQEAQARLREAAVIDPSNAEPHRRLARLLLASGERREAIEELRAVVRIAPEDAEAWRSLANAQYAEGLYEDALESYKGLGEASPAALARDSVQLAYADALRSAGRSAEARVIYRRLATSADADIAAASKRQLGQPTPSPTNEEADAAKEQPSETARADERRADDANRTTPEASASPAPQPTPARVETASSSTTTAAAPPRASTGSPSEQYQRGVGLWATNRAAAIAEFRAAAERGNSDASYYLGLSIAEGRDPRALKRAELVAAIVHFGRARKGRFRAQSVAYEEQLGRELDRRRNQGQ